MSINRQQKRKMVRELSKPNGLRNLFEKHDRMVQMETETFKKSKVRKRAIVAISALVVGLLTVLIFG